MLLGRHLLTNTDSLVVLVSSCHPRVYSILVLVYMYVNVNMYTKLVPYTNMHTVLEPYMYALC